MYTYPKILHAHIIRNTYIKLESEQKQWIAKERQQTNAECLCMFRTDFNGSQILYLLKL